MTAMERITMENQLCILLTLSEMVEKDSKQYEKIIDRLKDTDNYLVHNESCHKSIFY